MIRRVDLRGVRHTKAEVQELLPRATLDVNEAMKLIEPILARVKNGGAEDLYSLAQEFDGVRPPSLRVPQAALDAALAELNPEIRRSLEISIERIRKVHKDQVRAPHTTKVVVGGTVTQRWIPVDRVGLYVPGGRAV